MIKKNIKLHCNILSYHTPDTCRGKVQGYTQYKVMVQAEGERESMEQQVFTYVCTSVGIVHWVKFIMWLLGMSIPDRITPTLPFPHKDLLLHRVEKDGGKKTLQLSSSSGIQIPL